MEIFVERYFGLQTDMAKQFSGHVFDRQTAALRHFEELESEFTWLVTSDAEAGLRKV